MFSNSLVTSLAILLICLVVPSNALQKLLGGYPISISQAPYQVWFAFRFNHEMQFGDGFFCGGSIISQSIVLSAAHCFYTEGSSGNSLMNADSLVVVAGCSTREAAEDGTQELYIRKIVPHKSFDSISKINDIAMVFLIESISWNSSNVKAIQMARGPPTECSMCHISGWGSTVEDAFDEDRNPLYPSVLQRADVIILDHEECIKVFGDILKYHICASGDDVIVDTCQGDSGGPLVCSNRLSGVALYGKGCANPNIPGIYTDVSYYRDWIRSVNKTYGNSAFHSRKFNYLQIFWFILLYTFLI